MWAIACCSTPYALLISFLSRIRWLAHIYKSLSLSDRPATWSTETEHAYRQYLLYNRNIRKRERTANSQKLITQTTSSFTLHSEITESCCRANLNQNSRALPMLSKSRSFSIGVGQWVVFSVSNQLKKETCCLSTIVDCHSRVSATSAIVSSNKAQRILP